MATSRRVRFVRGQFTWMAVGLVALAALDALTLDLFFVVSLIGFLVIFEVTAPVNVTPRWRARLKWLLLAGLAGFAYVIADRILAILPPGVL